MTLKTTVDVNVFYDLLPRFFLGLCRVSLDYVKPHSLQRAEIPDWIAKLSTIMEGEGSLMSKYPGCLVADSEHWPITGASMTEHPTDENGIKLTGQVTSGHHRGQAQKLLVERLGLDETRRVWVYYVYHPGMLYQLYSLFLVRSQL
jgi:hypothetical protein